MTNFHNQKDELDFVRAQLHANQQAMQEFVYTVSHDLGAPLRAVTSFSRLLEQKYTDRLDEKGENYLRFVVEGGARAQAMLAGMLQYSRVYTRANPIVPVKLKDIADQSCVLLRSKIVICGVQIQIDDLPVVMADDDQMQQLFYAVLDNALTYRRPDIIPQIAVTAQDEGAFWKICITDNGIGVPVPQQERVFQLFKRLHSDESYPGVGVGLAVARRIVEKYNGQIGLTSAEPFGTTCWFKIPKLLDIPVETDQSLQVQHA